MEHNKNKVIIDLEINKMFLEAKLIDATQNYTTCSNEMLDVIDKMRLDCVKHQCYELAGVVKQFKIDLINKTGFLGKSIDDKIRELLE